MRGVSKKTALLAFRIERIFYIERPKFFTSNASLKIGSTLVAQSEMRKSPGYVVADSPHPERYKILWKRNFKGKLKIFLATIAGILLREMVIQTTAQNAYGVSMWILIPVIAQVSAKG